MFLCSVTSIVSDSAIPRTIARLSPLSMGFFKHEYWGGLPFPFPRDLPNPRIEPASLLSPALAGRNVGLRDSQSAVPLTPWRCLSSVQSHPSPRWKKLRGSAVDEKMPRGALVSFRHEPRDSAQISRSTQGQE